MRKGWKIEILDNIVDVKGGKRLPKGERLLDLPTGLPYIRVTDFENYTVNTSNLKYLEPHIQERIKNYIIKKEDVFISIAGTIGFVGKIPDELDGANLTENAARLIIKNKKLLDRDYLVYFLSANHNKEDLLSRMSKNAQPKLSLSNIKSFRLLLPSLPEQRKIAYILSNVQKAIEQQDKLIKVTAELKKAVMQKLFTEGLYGEPQKETEIGLVPESWEVTTISKMYDFTSKPRGLNVKTPVPFIPMELVPINERIITNYELRKSVSSGTYIENGDLLLAKITPSFENGKQGFVRIDKPYSYATTEVIPIKAKEKISSLDYLYYYLLKTDIRNQLTDKMEGSTGRQRLSKTILEETLIPKPTLGEQTEIAFTFISLDKKISFCEKKKQTLNALFKTLLHELMTGQRRVREIDFEALSKSYKIEEQPLSVAAEPEVNQNIKA